MRRVLVPVLVLALAACAANPQQLPVGVSVCSTKAAPQGLTIVANIENKSDRPISRLDLATAFYQNFRYRKLTASAELKQELDPGQRRDIAFDVAPSGGENPHGQAMRCVVTHIGYMDGTSQDAPPPQ